MASHAFVSIVYVCLWARNLPRVELEGTIDGRHYARHSAYKMYGLHTYIRVVLRAKI